LNKTQLGNSVKRVSASSYSRETRQSGCVAANRSFTVATGGLRTKKAVTTSLHTADIDSSAAVGAVPVDLDDHLSEPFNRSSPSIAGTGQYLDAVQCAIVDAATA
jgi:hypothetical protein